MARLIPMIDRRVSEGNRPSLVVAVIAAASFLFIVAAAHAAADVKAEITAAATHANLAAKAATVDAVHTHLHHVLNCLVGPKGKDFDTKALNPCAKLGDGAIPDSTDATQKNALESAVTQVEDGLKATDLQASQKIAGDVGAALKALDK
jgi:hypothetical protein